MAFIAQKYSELQVMYWNEEKERQKLKRILNGVCDKKYDIVLDIGCANGKLTSLLDSELTVGHIYGVDISEDVIEYAKQINTKDNISFIAQDFGVEFDSLAPELKALEGKVSLIFSNGVFALIPNSANLAQNIYRLLSNGGEVYATVFHPFSPNTAPALAGRKAIHELEFRNIPDPETSIGNYVDAFKSAGLDVVSRKNYANKAVMKFNHFNKIVMPVVPKIASRYITVNDKVTLEAIGEELLDLYLDNCRRFTDDATGDEMIECDQEHSWIKLRKHK